MVSTGYGLTASIVVGLTELLLHPNILMPGWVLLSRSSSSSSSLLSSSLYLLSLLNTTIPVYKIQNCYLVQAALPSGMSYKKPWNWTITHQFLFKSVPMGSFSQTHPPTTMDAWIMFVLLYMINTVLFLLWPGIFKGLCSPLTWLVKYWLENKNYKNYKNTLRIFKRLPYFLLSNDDLLSLYPRLIIK